MNNNTNYYLPATNKRYSEFSLGLSGKMPSSEGVYTLLSIKPVYNEYTEYIKDLGTASIKDDLAFIDYEVIPLQGDALQKKLQELKDKKQEEFQVVFTLMDEKRIRPSSQILIETLENTLTSETMDTSADVNILWQLNEIAEENRHRLNEIMNMTDYEEIVAVKPINPY